MNLENRISLLEQLAAYMINGDEEWQDTIRRAHEENPWFLPEFIDYQAGHIAKSFLPGPSLREWTVKYSIPGQALTTPLNVGVVMAGNIPMAGFHDFLSVFLSGHRQTIKTSTRDTVLITQVVKKLTNWEPEVGNFISISGMLKGCDAFIATGSNHTSRYFDYYFGKYPHIIRRNRTSAAVLDGTESKEELEGLADDVFRYFGLGCRSVTKLYVPEDYDFLPLLEAFRKYDYLAEHHKYKNNYDYQLTILIINKLFYMTNGSVLLLENNSLFSPISVLHYEFYKHAGDVYHSLLQDPGIQCIVGREHIPFGKSQQPALADYADKADTLQFLLEFS